MRTLDERAHMRARRRAVKTRVRQLLGGALVAVMCVASMVALAQRMLLERSDSSSSTAATTTHRLLTDSVANDTDADDSCGALADWERHGGVVVYLVALLYVFVALAIICDDYFVTALERITDRLGLSKDVAGATFMAAGSSAPELFVSLADNVLAKPEASLGIGTIVGSAIFNILVIIALSALLAGQDLVLDWRPLLRDSLWYCWAIVLLTISVWDGQVDVVEAAMLFGSYACYIAFMSQNDRVVNRCCQRPADIDLDDVQTDTSVLTEISDTGGIELAAADVAAADRAAAAVAGSTTNQQSVAGSTRPWTIDVERPEPPTTAPITRKTSDSALPLHRTGLNGAATDDPRARFAAQGSASNVNPIYQSKYRMFQYHAHSTTLAPVKADLSKPIETQTVGPLAGDAEALGPYFAEVFDVPDSVLGKLWFAYTRPIVVIARLTIPDCRYPQFSSACGFSATFAVAIAWIAVLSHFTVVWATKVGCIAGIPSALMGLTLVAAGTSVPDALSSILVARDGHGDMAVSNALGSNVFDILLGLGLPFFLSNLVYKEPVAVATDDLALSISILFAILLALVAMLILSRWRLRKTVGGLLLVLYAVYVVVSYLRGLGKI